MITEEERTRRDELLKAEDAYYTARMEERPCCTAEVIAFTNSMCDVVELQIGKNPQLLKQIAVRADDNAFTIGWVYEGSDYALNYGVGANVGATLDYCASTLSHRIGRIGIQYGVTAEHVDNRREAISALPIEEFYRRVLRYFGGDL